MIHNVASGPSARLAEQRSGAYGQLRERRSAGSTQRAGIGALVVMLLAGACATERQTGNRGLSSGAIFEFGPCQAAGATCGPEGRRSAAGGDAALWRGGPFRAGPYLVTQSDGRFAVTFATTRRAGAHAPVVDWWISKSGTQDEPAPEDVRHAAAQLRDGLWVVLLGPFEPGSRVSYRIALTPKQTSETYRFSTGVRAGEPFRFIAYGDTRTYHLVHWRVINAMAQHEAEFVVHTGDLVENGGVEEEWLTFLSIVRPVAARSPFLVALGNHDLSPKGLFRHFFLFDLPSHLRGDAAQPLQRYYSRDWGNLRVILLDPELEYRAGSSQYEYMERQMAEAAQRGMYIVVVSHRPPYSSGSHGSYKAMRKVMDVLGPRYGVELMISGHDHNYERTKSIKGTTYIVTGGGGAPIHPVNPQEFCAAVRTEPHYVLVDVDQNGLAVQALNLAGEVFDSYLVKPNPPLEKNLALLRP